MGAPGKHGDAEDLTATPQGLRKRSVVIAGHRTSVSLEQAFWDELGDLARWRGVSVNALVGEIDRARTGNLSSALRLHVLESLKARDTEHPPSA
jgi:predicted DNA-binding ribbon-helix-helix protein